MLHDLSRTVGLSRRAFVSSLGAVLLMPRGVRAAEPSFTFASIDGGTIDLASWRGTPVLVVNTASMCGFTPQYDDLQALSDKYGPQGLHVLAVPSNDFNQELDDAKAVKEFCAVNFNLTLPMSEITHVTGPQAHPFYAWVARTNGFAPNWNFNKVLLGPDGAVVQTWGSLANPMSGNITRPIEALLK